MSKPEPVANPGPSLSTVKALRFEMVAPPKSKPSNGILVDSRERPALFKIYSNDNPILNVSPRAGVCPYLGSDQQQTHKPFEMQQLVLTLLLGITLISAFGCVLYFKPKPKTLPDPQVIIFRYCVRNYRRIKKRIAVCGTDKEIRQVTTEADDFYTMFYERVPDPTLRGLYRDLLITISAKKSKIVTHGSAI